MDGVFVISGDSQGITASSKVSTLRLLFKHAGVEVMHLTSKPGATMWVSPAAEADLAEYYYVLRGSVTLMLRDGERKLFPGDAFYASGLSEDLRIDSPRGCELMYIATKPVFDGIFSFHADFHDILAKIDEKDNVTLTHSRKVMRYAVALADSLGWDRLSMSMDDMVTAALFHDVGKCYVPDEILKKQGKLTPAEYELMKGHATGTQALRQRFGDRVADIAGKHHERLDGSGYPLGLAGEEIPLASRVIAVADAFDAMTSGRVYAPARTPEEAIAELRAYAHQYDSEVIDTLARLLAEGALDKIRTETNKSEGKIS